MTDIEREHRLRQLQFYIASNQGWSPHDIAKHFRWNATTMAALMAERTHRIIAAIPPTPNTHTAALLGYHR